MVSRRLLPIIGSQRTNFSEIKKQHLDIQKNVEYEKYATDNSVSNEQSFTDGFEAGWKSSSAFMEKWFAENIAPLIQYHLKQNIDFLGCNEINSDIETLLSGFVNIDVKDLDKREILPAGMIKVNS